MGQVFELNSVSLHTFFLGPISYTIVLKVCYVGIGSKKKVWYMRYMSTFLWYEIFAVISIDLNAPGNK